MLVAGSLSTTSIIHKSLAIKEDIYETVYKPSEKFHTWTGIPIALKTKSRGRILLNSRNPFHKSRIHFDFFKEPTDLESLLLAVKKVLEVRGTQE
jgi:hypothetical protein